MEGWFAVYWRMVGLPLSRMKGFCVDKIPFSTVESMVWIGLFCAFGLAVITASAKKYPWAQNRHLRITLAVAPIMLLCMAMGQGAFPLSLAPTAWRTPLAKVLPGPALPYSDFSRELHFHESRLVQEFASEEYASLSEPEILSGCNQALDHVLTVLNLSPGRPVRAIKSMGPITTLLGLAYGGPAFHDPFFGELAMVRPEDMPTPRYWRLIGICHEEAHAKGFTREMDAEILTELALLGSSDRRYRMLGDLMFIRKAGEKVHYPEPLRNEMIAMRDSLARVESRQPVVNAFRRLSKRMGFQNSSGKYGSRNPAEAWDPSHPFYATVLGLLPKFDSLPAGPLR